jgi:tripartite-type tricarboxylate transporter receptor subunit TctC
MTSRREFHKAALSLTALGALGTSTTLRAQTAPETAKILVGFPPGGTTDAISRRVADKLRGNYANTVIVENKPGAGGQIAVSALKDAPADGSVMLLTPSSILSIYPFTYPKLPYTLADVAPASVACFFSHGFGVGPAVPDTVKTLKDFIAWAKANPGKASFATPAAGSMPHLIGALLGKLTGTDLNAVHYRGSAPGITDLLGGQIAAMSSPVGDYLQHIKTGKLRLLATSGPQRSPFTPDVPSYREQGVDIALREWYGFFLPGRANAAAQQRAAAALKVALAGQDVITTLQSAGMEPESSTPEQLAAWLKSDADVWGPLVKKIGFTAES